jgi:hypothetical protein
MGDPAIRVLLLIFVREDRLERSPVLVKGNHIGRSKRRLG